ncbi:MAG: YdeI/OmpD-associated family protein [Dehalococcoidia bacterium]
MTAADLPTIPFKGPAAWSRWLAKNHADSVGIWMRLFKKGTAQPSITYAEALDEALAYGWIDGQKKSADGDSWLQKFTPRRPRSGWSRINTRHAERLIREERMKHAGLAQVEAARADGRWDRAYDSPSASTLPDDFLAALKKDWKAQAFFDGLNKSNKYAIAYRLQTAKRPETREKRMRELLAMLSRGEKLH